jgi:hypothetical protein
LSFRTPLGIKANWLVLLNNTARGLRGATGLCFQINIELPLVPASTSPEEIDDKQQDDGSRKLQT